MSRVASRLVSFLVLLALLSFARMSAAHPSPHSTVLLDIRAHEVDAELRLPIAELQVALHRPLMPKEARIVDEDGASIRDYVAQYLHATTRDGAPWAVAVGSEEYRVEDGHPFLVIEARLSPPAGQPADSFVLEYDVISHEVANHTAWVAVRSDFANGDVDGPPTVVGVIRYLRKSLVVDRSGGGATRGLLAMVRLGVKHIAEGTDHLLFLIALLLPAPLLLARRDGGSRWGAYGGLRKSVVSLLRVVTAFTLGHSLTLLLGTVGWLHVPSGPVEVLVALSILVSAVHALRPIFPGREAWVAAAFGLVHGMAFATALAELRLDAYHLGIAVFGFNLGIELMQLVVVALTFPWLVLLARTRAYGAVRIVGAAFAGAAAIGWIGERALHAPNPIAALAWRSPACGPMPPARS